jgi:putative PEP-CTERM system histidine kinase
MTNDQRQAPLPGWDWTFQIALSRRVVFHSTALFAAGLYMLFIAGAGYYVRYFGGSWGGALQVALLFAGLLMLGALAFSGSMRAKLRVLVSKHFFSYRYDYRDEWLRFTQALSTKEGELRLGQQVIKGLADLVESPAGGLWLIEAGGRSFAQAARWNLPASAAIEEIDSAFSRFLRESGWS